MFLPEGLERIGEQAFIGCKGLRDITFSKTVKEIGKLAFTDCTSLENVYVKDIAAWCKIKFLSNVSTPFYYAKNLYLNGSLVTNLVIPEGVTSISGFAF